MKKRILFVGHADSIHIKKWVDYFLDNGCECLIANFAQNNITGAPAVSFMDKPVSVGGGNYQYLLKIKALADLITHYCPTNVNAHFSYSMGFISALAIRLSKYSRKQIRFSVVCHGTDVLDLAHARLYKMANLFTFGEVDCIFAVSSQIVERLRSWGVNCDKIVDGFYGIDEAYLERSEVEKNIDILSYRSYVPNSRLDELFETLGSSEELRQRKIVCVVPLASEEQLMLFRKLYPHIQFYEGMEHAKIINLAKRARIYVSTTRSDGTSLSLLEAMACGCTPIVSDIPANRTWINNAINGYLFSEFAEIPQLITGVLEGPVSFCKQNEALIREKALYGKRMHDIAQLI